LKADLKRKLHQAASESRLRAHAPYSRFRVGAALLSDKGVFTGCNVENVSFGGTICAERTAFVKAISEGAKSFKAIVIVTEPSVPPCALCLQVMAEFCGPDFEIVLSNPKKIVKEATFSDFLPHAFYPRKFT
jgi:cytidine deaminase